MDIEEGEEEHRRDGETAAVRRRGKTDAATSAPDGSHRPREKEGDYAALIISFLTGKVILSECGFRPSSFLAETFSPPRPPSLLSLHFTSHHINFHSCGRLASSSSPNVTLHTLIHFFSFFFFLAPPFHFHHSGPTASSVLLPLFPFAGDVLSLRIQYSQTFQSEPIATSPLFPAFRPSFYTARLIATIHAAFIVELPLCSVLTGSRLPLKRRLIPLLSSILHRRHWRRLLSERGSERAS